LIGELTQLAEEQASSRRVEAALRRVATLVAQGVPADELSAAVTEDVGRLLTADFARLARYDPSDSLTVIAAWGRTGDHFPIGSRWPLAGENVSSFVLQPAVRPGSITSPGPPRLAPQLLDPGRCRGLEGPAGTAAPPARAFLRWPPGAA
jgi:GAF domain-containing protein